MHALAAGRYLEIVGVCSHVNWAHGKGGVRLVVVEWLLNPDFTSLSVNFKIVDAIPESFQLGQVLDGDGVQVGSYHNTHALVHRVIRIGGGGQGGVYVRDTHRLRDARVAVDGQAGAALHAPLHIGIAAVRVFARTEGHRIGRGVHVLFFRCRAEVDGRAGHDGRLAHVGHADGVGPQGTRVHALLIDPIVVTQGSTETGIDAGIADHFLSCKISRIILVCGVRHHLAIVITATCRTITSYTARISNTTNTTSIVIILNYSNTKIYARCSPIIRNHLSYIHTLPYRTRT